MRALRLFCLACAPPYAPAGAPAREATGGSAANRPYAHTPSLSHGTAVTPNAAGSAGPPATSAGEPWARSRVGRSRPSTATSSQKRRARSMSCSTATTVVPRSATRRRTSDISSCGAHVEVRGRLVKEKGVRLLRKRHRDEGPLPLAAREPARVAVRQSPEPHEREGIVHGTLVLLAQLPKRTHVRVAPAGHEVPYPHGRGPVHLRQKRDAPGPLPGGKPGHRPAAHEHRPARRHPKAVRKAKERRLSAAVGAKDAKHLPPGNLEVEAVEERTWAAEARYVAKLERRCGVTHRDTPFRA